MPDIRAVVTGVSGRMGSLLVRMVREAPGFRLTAGTDKPGSTLVGVDVGLATKGAALGVLTSNALDLTNADVVIDFSAAEASVEHARLCSAKGVAMVVGSTGFTADGRRAMEDAAKRIPLVLAPNMSIGVNLVIEVAAQLARRLGEDFDIEVLEAHHRHKRDAPSGTAVRLAEELATATGRTKEALRTSRVGNIGERTSSEIGVQSLRGGDVVGEHTVFFFGDGERVELTHRASSREQFGRGALRAARWVVGRAPGLYDMSHVLRDA